MWKNKPIHPFLHNLSVVMVLVTTIESKLGQCGFLDIIGHFVPGPLWVFSVGILHRWMLPLTSSSFAFPVKQGSWKSFSFSVWCGERKIKCWLKRLEVKAESKVSRCLNWKCFLAPQTFFKGMFYFYKTEIQGFHFLRVVCTCMVYVCDVYVYLCVYGYGHLCVGLGRGRCWVSAQSLFALFP